MGIKVHKKTSTRVQARLRRRRHVRKQVFGTTERPRLSVFRSNKHIYAQVIDDTTGQTVAAVSTLSPVIRERAVQGDKKGGAKLVGVEIAAQCLGQQIDQIVFDRGGYLYTGGRVRALAEAAREAGLKF
ncbi:MAG: 50S ribosomal protein L18 [Bradymonadales bacterium]|nr:50S ribosomal protein L18 [Bradymonadales bacterium]